MISMMIHGINKNDLKRYLNYIMKINIQIILHQRKHSIKITKFGMYLKEMRQLKKYKNIRSNIRKNIIYLLDQVYLIINILLNQRIWFIMENLYIQMILIQKIFGKLFNKSFLILKSFDYNNFFLESIK